MRIRVEIRNDRGENVDWSLPEERAFVTIADERIGIVTNAIELAVHAARNPASTSARLLEAALEERNAGG